MQSSRLRLLSHPQLRLLAVCLPMLVAGCFGARGRSPAAGAPARADSGLLPIARDSQSVADSIARAAAAAVTVIPALVDSAKLNAALRAAADSIARSDSATKKTPRKPAPKATKECVLDFNESPEETRLRFLRLPDSTSLTFIGGGFVGHCQGENNKIRADSAEQYEASGVLNLFGNVSYEEPNKIRIQSDNATYFSREERMFATGNVVATQFASGSTFRGSSIEYLRPIPASRPQSRLIAINRPTMQIIEKDSSGQPGVPVTVTANTMVDEGDSLLVAWGQVQINRELLVGESDSASFDKVSERARLLRTARIINRDTAQPFRLFGDTIDLYSKDRQLERVVALHKGNASNDDVVMLAERIDLRFVEQKLSRAFAFGAGRATATTTSQKLEADSIDIRLRLQRVQQLRAIGGAIATGTPDTLKVISDDRDVLRGDTITAWFDTTGTPGDTTKSSQVRDIHAEGNASSLFLIASKSGPRAPPALNYVRGVTIRVHFDSGEVHDVTVDSSATGLYLEPVSDSLADSTAGRRTLPRTGRRPPPASPAPQEPWEQQPVAHIVSEAPIAKPKPAVLLISRVRP